MSKKQADPQSQTDHFREQFNARVPPEIARTFSPEQIQAVKKAFGRSPRKHAIDLRFTSPIPGLRFYFVLLAGKERRSRQRLRAERGKFPIWTPGNIVTIGIFSVLLLLTGTSTIYLFMRSLTLPGSGGASPVVIPWVTSEGECEKRGYTWLAGRCWDQEGDPWF